jgi:hypothetical protein
MNMEKPVKEEMSVSAVMPLINFGVDAGPYCSGADRDSTVQLTWTIETLRTETDSHQSPHLVPLVVWEVMPPWGHDQLKLAHKSEWLLQPDDNLRFVLVVEHEQALVVPAAAAAAASSVGLGCLFHVSTLTNSLAKKITFSHAQKTGDRGQRWLNRILSWWRGRRLGS